jgi:S-adenosylmethionine:tRNA ribosyltransferase-isomerase
VAGRGGDGPRYTRGVDLAAFEYALPRSAVAQSPLERRDASRLLVIDRATRQFRDQTFGDLPELLRARDCVVLNDSRVIPARVFARATGSDRPVEIVFIAQEDHGRWRALTRPGRHTRPGAVLWAGGEECARLRVVAVDREGFRVVERLDGTIENLMARHGLPPLPPYIARHAKPGDEDWERYQTVYARPPGSVAAPTAGLHFTPALFDGLRARGIEVHALTLHVGVATFRPLRAAEVDTQALPPERAVLPPSVAQAVNAARDEGRRVVAVGTTTTRALEAAALRTGRVEPLDGEVDLFIRPGHAFRVVDALLTNFHLPRSSLLVLVSAFADLALILAAYAYAVRAGYRFYSYGDATLIE